MNDNVLFFYDEKGNNTPHRTNDVTETEKPNFFRYLHLLIEMNTAIRNSSIALSTEMQAMILVFDIVSLYLILKIHYDILNPLISRLNDRASLS